MKPIASHYIKLPKSGLVQFKTGQQIPDKIKSVTVKRSPTGKYYAVLLVDCESQVFDKTNQQIGTDLGISDLMVYSNEKKIPTIRFDKILASKKHYWEKRLARRRLIAQRAISWDQHNKVLSTRCLDNFKNYQRAKLMVAKLNEKIANQRKNYLHKLTTRLVKENDVIVIEDLKTKNLLHNHSLARAMANQSWR
ncbi:transposase, partial [Sporolactobacillus sp. THM7-4]